MPETASTDAPTGGERLTIAALRAELGDTLEQFARRIGLSSKGQMSTIETTGRATLKPALEIEALSGGRIDAADLNEDVRAARAALVGDGSGDSGQGEGAQDAA